MRPTKQAKRQSTDPYNDLHGRHLVYRAGLRIPGYENSLKYSNRAQFAPQNWNYLAAAKKYLFNSHLYAHKSKSTQLSPFDVRSKRKPHRNNPHHQHPNASAAFFRTPSTLSYAASTSTHASSFKVASPVPSSGNKTLLHSSATVKKHLHSGRNASSIV